MILLALSLAIALAQKSNDLWLLDYLLIAGCVLGLLGAAIPLAQSFLNWEGGKIEWATWGRFGIGLIGLSAMLGLLCLFRATG
jgi:hypothetical protein